MRFFDQNMTENVLKMKVGDLKINNRHHHHRLIVVRNTVKIYIYIVAESN